MDVLASADAEGIVQEAVFFPVADLLNFDVDLLFFDTASTYCEIDEEDDEGGEGEEAEEAPAPLRPLRGPPARPARRSGSDSPSPGRDPGPGLGGPGNTADQAVIEEVKADLAGWRVGRRSGSSIAAS